MGRRDKLLAVLIGATFGFVVGLTSVGSGTFFGLHAMAWLLIGSIPGVLIGANLSIKVPERALRVAFAFVLVLSGVRLVKFPAATTIVEVGAGVAALVFIVWSVVSIRNRRLPAADAA